MCEIENDAICGCVQVNICLFAVLIHKIHVERNFCFQTAMFCDLYCNCYTGCSVFLKIINTVSVFILESV